MPDRFWAKVKITPGCWLWQAGTFAPRPGEANGRAVLTEGDVKAIRASVASIWDLAQAYGVSWQNIKLILARKSWKHVA